MNWSTIQSGVKAWAEGTTGLTAYWRNQQVPAFTPKPFILLQIIATSKVDVDSLDYVYDNTQPPTEEMVPTLSGYRKITVAMTVVSRDQTANFDAINYLELARAGLNQPQYSETLTNAGLALVWTSQGISLQDAIVDNRYESRAAMDIIFRAVQYIQYKNPNDTNGYITQTEVSSDVDGVAESSQMDNEIIGIKP